MNANLCAGAIWTWRERVSCSTHWGAEPESVSAHSVGSSAWWAYTVENALSIIRWNVSIKIKEMLIPVCFNGCVQENFARVWDLEEPSHVFSFLTFFFKKKTLEVSDGWQQVQTICLISASLSLAECSFKWAVDDTTRGPVMPFFYSAATMNEPPKTRARSPM